MRLDQYLVKMGLCRSRTRAAELIKAGLVEVKQSGDYAEIKKPGYKCSENTEVIVKEPWEHPWVARSGEKLFQACHKLGLDFKNFRLLDVGQSTGGFTQCALELGAKKVVGLDVGTGQLSSLLADKPNVESFEKMDVRTLSEASFSSKFDFFVVDLSFISFLKVAAHIKAFLPKGVDGLVLIKPQFEVGKSLVNSKGVVLDPLIHIECERRILQGIIDLGYSVKDYFPSDLRGKDGNQEFFCYLCT